MAKIIMGIESSCDDTSVAIVSDGILLSNKTGTQDVHFKYGGVVPELASRAHQQNIIPVAQEALKDSGVPLSDISAIAFTQGPGLLGSLLVGSSFAKGLGLSLGIPIIGVNHMQGHILSSFIVEKANPEKLVPEFPFLSLVVSGGHTMLVVVKDYFDLEVIGSTIDDAAGEAFDKCAKILNLGYPGGPVVDERAKRGDPTKFRFSKPRIPGHNFSFSGLKTSFLYTIRDALKEDSQFIEKNIDNLCASLQKTIIDILIKKTENAMNETRCKNLAIAGGVAANSGLRERLTDVSGKFGWNLHLPEKKYTTDNAAMIAVTGYYMYLKNMFSTLDAIPNARMSL